MNKELYLYRVGYLKKSKFPEGIREKVKYNFIICSNSVEPYLLTLENFIPMDILMNFTEIELNKIARAYGLRILKWHSVTHVKEGLYYLKDFKYTPTYQRLGKDLQSFANRQTKAITEELKKRKEERDLAEIRKKLAEFGITMGYVSSE
jgi:hypothetical protein